MEARELRIGNYVNYKSYNAMITLNDFSEFNRNLLDIMKPIPLTEEWLLKFGLKHNGYNDEDKAIHCINDEVWFLQNIVTKKYNLDQYELEIKYVHQLQNLYFALTGDELTIK